MKITHWAKYCSVVTVMATMVACGTKPAASDEQIGIQQMSEDQAKDIPGVIVKVITDSEGNPISKDVRQLPKGVDLGSFSAEEAEAIHANAPTVNEDTSADSFYAAGCGGYSSTVVYSSTINNGCNDLYYGNNYNTAWNGYNYSNTQYSSSTYYSNTQVSGGGYPVYGCGASYSCYNNAYAAWPGYYRRWTPVRNFIRGVGNWLLGYRYPFARAAYMGNARYYGYPTCGYGYGC